jgi:predicted NBD/HSP70 family sugar kinase
VCAVLGKLVAQPHTLVQTASSEVVRDINRRSVWNLIRTRQPISRADLARLSGLQRSTVSLIVEELIDEGWVLEGPTGRLPRGRRPTFLRLNEERLIVGVVVRPLQTTVALADVNGRFLSHEVLETPPGPKAGIQAIVSAIRRLSRTAGRKIIEGVGIGLPGRVNHSAGTLVFAPNLGWSDCDLRGPISQATGLEVEVENAANACALAAVWFDRLTEHAGRTQAVSNLVAITVSEGIGTGIVMNGQLVRGFRGMAGEFGHVSLDPHGASCACGSRGCWEVFASNRAALRYYHQSNTPAGRGDGAAALDFPGLLRRAEQGDVRAGEALDRMARYLGQGMRMVVAGLAPERILIIGDLTAAWPRFGPLIEAEVRAQALPGGSLPQVVPVHEDGQGRMRGAIALVFQKRFGAPGAAS